MYAWFPSNLTVGENLKLTRQLFPLFFQFVLLFCDFTIDAPYELTEEEIIEKKREETYMSDFAKD
jgi:hypothetical protein